MEEYFEMQDIGFGEWFVWVKVRKKKEINFVKQKFESDFFGVKKWVFLFYEILCFGCLDFQSIGYVEFYFECVNL